LIQVKRHVFVSYFT